jgi:hypothetical protein
MRSAPSYPKYLPLFSGFRRTAMLKFRASLTGSTRADFARAVHFQCSFDCFCGPIPIWRTKCIHPVRQQRAGRIQIGFYGCSIGRKSDRFSPGFS